MWWQRQRGDEDFGGEIRAHVTIETDRLIAQGLNPDAARAAAHRAFGNVTRAEERFYESRRVIWLDDLWRDLRYAVRTLRRAPGFTAVAILMLALGIGATTAIFSAVNAVLLTPLPFPEPERLINIRETNLGTGTSAPVSSANFLDWRDRIPALETVAGWHFEYFNIAGRDQPEQVQGYRVSASYLPLLGAQPAAGRLFRPEDEQAGHERVAVLTAALWRRRFGAAPNLVGQTIDIEGQPFTVVGVLSASFPSGQILNRPIDLFVPLVFEAGALDRRSHDLNVSARLKAGVTLAQAQAQLDEQYRALANAYPAADASLSARGSSMPDDHTRGSRPVLWLLLSAAGTVLLIACANIATLLLARAAVRQKEMALRAALGAARGRLIRQLLAESILLALLGGLAGTLVAMWGVSALNDLVPSSVVGRFWNFSLNGRVFAFSCVLSLVSGVVFGLAPARRSASHSLNETLESTGRGTAASGLRTRRAGRLLVVAQLALAVVLVNGALLLLLSALALQDMPRGLNLHSVLTMQIWLPRARYPHGAQTARFFHDVIGRVAQVPGVESASVINFPPLAAQDTGVALRIEGRAPEAPSERLVARYSVIDPAYFHTMQIPVLTGRAFTDSDADETRGVAIISAAMAHRFWPNTDPIGRRIQPQFTGEQHFWDADFKNLPLTIVGVVGDVRDDGQALRGRDDVPLFYLPYPQNPAWLMHLVIRTRSHPLDAVPAVRRAVWTVDENQPVFDTKTLEDIVAETFGQPRVMATLTGAFAVAALLLAALGVYGLLSHVVSQRTHDIGIRMALGAQPEDVLQAILRDGTQIGLAGIAVGLTVSFGATRLLAGFLFGVGATDPLTFAGVAALLFGITLAAGFVPARRAMRVDPIVALRHE